MSDHALIRFARAGHGLHSSAEWEAALVRSASGGDQAALGALLARCCARLIEELRFEVGPQLSELYAAEDAAQDAFDYALRNFDQFEYRGDGSFYAWVKQIAKHRAIDAARAQAAAKRGGQAQRVRITDQQATTFGDSIDALRYNSDTPTRESARAERAQAIRVALLQLNANEREVVALRFFEHLDWAAVAERLGNSVSSVRSVAHRALDKLEETLGSISRYLSQG